MSPPVFLLGSFSILTVWVIGALGLPADLWTFGVIPTLSVYSLCDQRKLWEAAVQLRGPRGRVVSPTIVVVVGILSARFIPWKVCVLLVWLLCMVRAFDFEKLMYMMDTYGSWAKSLVWKVIYTFTGEAMWMSYKGEWAFCCPYTRQRGDQEMEQYYTLQLQREEQSDMIIDNYDLAFSIGSCKVHVVYTAATDDHVGGSGDYTPASAVVSSPVESRPSVVPNTGPHGKASAEAESSSSATSSMEGESSSSKADHVQDNYSLVKSHVDMVQVSLEYLKTAKKTTLESYTFYDMDKESVAELKRVLTVLKDEGSIIFATLNRDIGSSRPRAHARCHEFEELFDLILTQGYKLHAVDLHEKYQCIISGRWTWLLPQVFSFGLMSVINYYQLDGHPKLSTTLSLLILYAVLHLFSVLVFHIFEEESRCRKLVHFVISKVAPSRLDDCYKYFFVHYPTLTFGNESYCYPYTVSRREVCMLETCGSIGRLPVIGKVPEHFILEEFRDGTRVFELRNLYLELTVMSVDDTGQVMTNGKVHVGVQMRKNFDDRACCYNQGFQVEKSRAADFIAMMKWLERNGCVGVGKKWPRSGLMLAYRYDELFQKVLGDGLRPMIMTCVSPIDIRVE